MNSIESAILKLLRGDLKSLNFFDILEKDKYIKLVTEKDKKKNPFYNRILSEIENDAITIDAKSYLLKNLAQKCITPNDVEKIIYIAEKIYLAVAFKIDLSQMEYLIERYFFSKIENIEIDELVEMLIDERKEVILSIGLFGNKL